MKMGFFRKGLRVFFILLFIASVSISIVSAETTGELNGTVLTLKDETNFTVNSTYKIFFPQDVLSGKEKVINCSTKGTLTYPDSGLESQKTEFNINISKKDDNNTFNTSVAQGLIVKVLSAPISTPSAIATPIHTTPTQATHPEETSQINKFLENYGVYLIIIGLFILVLSALWVYLNLKPEEDPEQRLVSPSIAILTNKLQIDLQDESGTERIKDAKVRAVNKKGMPYPARVDFDGTYSLELPKGTYKIEIDGGVDFESTSREVGIPSTEERIRMSLIKKQPIQIEVVDEASNPISGINVSVKEIPSGVDANGSPGVTNNTGIVKFTISRSKQYALSVRSQTGEFVEQMNISLSSSETTKKIQLFKKAGNIEITVSEQATGKSFAGIPVSLMKKGTSQTIDTDNNGRINQNLSIGDYIVRLEASNPPLYDPVEKPVSIFENKTSSVTLDLRFDYQPKPEFLSSISKINEKLNTGFQEVSAYDTCIPLFFKKVGEKPLQLVDKIIKRPAEFLGAKTGPEEIIKYTFSTAEFLAGEISRIMREKSNVDFYFSIQNLPPVDDLTISDYSQEKFSELVRDTANYHKNHFREVGNKLDGIDNELTQLSGTLTIQPAADLWRVAQKLQENSINEADAKKRGVMLFINDKLLDHVREMYTKEEVKARLKFSML